MASSILRKGSKGDEVSILQATLHSVGFFSGQPDGNFGEDTEKAVRAFQQKYGILVDGEVGQKTWDKLSEVSANTSRRSGTLKVTNLNGTYFKLRAEQATHLSEKELYKAEYGWKSEYSFIDSGKEGGHYKVHFAPGLTPKDWPNGVQTWFVYPEDVVV